MEKNVRIPQQKRSIEKKKNVIEAAQKLFNEKGYSQTNTSDIAKEAGLSVCSVYSYFKDKKDIFISCLQENSEKIKASISEKIAEISKDKDVIEIIKDVYYVFIEAHNFSKIYHNDAMSLKYVDDDVRSYFQNERLFFAEATIKQLKEVGITLKHEKEQTFLIYSLFENLEDELIYSPDANIDKDIVVNECAQMIVSILDAG